MAENKEIKILTNHWGQKASPTWGAVTTYLPPEGFDLKSSMKLALRLYSRRRDFDCVVLGAGFSDTLFALMQAMIPFKKAPCVMIDCIWYEDPNKFRHFLKTAILKMTSRGVDKFVVWASREVEAYSEAFGIPQEKFVYVPYHTTLDTFDIKSSEGDYIFSGGNFGRDYDTLISAVRGLPVKVLIASTRPELFSHLDIPENVEVRGFSNEEFLKKMAGCLMNVVPLDADLLHSGGQQTFLNSMWFGKSTIVNDPEGAADYINDGEDGLLVPKKDPAAMREAILFLLSNPFFCRDCLT
ncbi:MAG: glycosyltransferase, partial [Candidatus Manganitrophaceae bacterium]